MGRKLNVPSVTGLNIEGVPFGVVVFLQAVQDALNTLDSNVVYKSDITANVGSPRVRALTAQGQAFSVSGVNLASGDDYATLVSNVRTILEDHNQLRAEVIEIKNQLKGS